VPIDERREMREVSGGELVADVLERSGVEVVFMLHGAHVHGVVLGCLERGIRIVAVRHEAAAGHAAEGVARAGRRLGVALVTAGPGMTNVVTSMADAYADRLPVLYLSGSVPVFHDETNALQSGIDQIALASPITKWAGRAHRTEDIPRLLAQAVRTALTPPAGPVFLEIPIDVLNGSVGVPQAPVPERVLLGAKLAPSREDIDTALELLGAAARPAIMAGGDVYAAGASEALRAFARAAGLPVFAQFEALGALPCDDPLFAGTFWQLSQLAKELQPDLVLALGVRFGWNAPGFQVAIDADVVHVDVDPKEFGRPRPARLAILADPVETLAAFNERVGSTSVGATDRSGWLADVRSAIAQGIETAWATRAESDHGVHPYRIGQIVCDSAGPDAIVIGDGALTKHWLDDAVSTTRQEPGTYFTHGHLGAMGIGLGLAMGAQIANPDRRVVCVTGDGSIGFTLAEFDTMIRNDLPIVAVVMNNHSFFGLDRFPRLADGTMPTIATDLGAVGYGEVAKAFGGFGRTVEREEDLAPAIDAALASGLPACIDVLVSEGFGFSFSMGAFRVMQ
jgi:thiamine pyrophosphate-dependent acetolactate synthase large subunit-like protein